MKNNKGQAGVEFLMTYGWAILVVLVAVGMLTYLGLFGEQKTLSRDNIYNTEYSEKFCEALNKKYDTYDYTEKTITCQETVGVDELNTTALLLSTYTLG